MYRKQTPALFVLPMQEGRRFLRKLFSGMKLLDLIWENLEATEESEDITESSFLGEGEEETHVCGACVLESIRDNTSTLEEAEYRGRKVQLNKPMQGDVKKFKVYVKDPQTKNVKKVNFGDPNMTIKKSNPQRRKSFRARHRCDTPGPKTSARYWSCRKW